jgi:hypothetical protein
MTRITASPASPPTVPPAIVPGGVESLSLSLLEEAVADGEGDPPWPPGTNVVDSCGVAVAVKDADDGFAVMSVVAGDI